MPEPDSKLQRALDAMNRADIDIGVTALREGRLQGPQHAAEMIGRSAINTLCEAFDLDVDEVLVTLQRHGSLQADATIAAIGASIADEQTLELFRGTTIGGMFTGLRLGLVIAHLGND